MRLFASFVRRRRLRRFPDEMRQTTDVLEIIRTWQFRKNHYILRPRALARRLRTCYDPRAWHSIPV